VNLVSFFTDKREKMNKDRIKANILPLYGKTTPRRDMVLTIFMARANWP
jgi:hypothetical protein